MCGAEIQGIDILTSVSPRAIQTEPHYNNLRFWDCSSRLSNPSAGGGNTSDLQGSGGGRDVRPSGKKDGGGGQVYIINAPNVFHTFLIIYYLYLGWRLVSCNSNKNKSSASTNGLSTNGPNPNQGGGTRDVTWGDVRGKGGGRKSIILYIFEMHLVYFLLYITFI